MQIQMPLELFVYSVIKFNPGWHRIMFQPQQIQQCIAMARAGHWDHMEENGRHFIKMKD